MVCQTLKHYKQLKHYKTMINYIKLSIAKEYFRIFYQYNANNKKADFVYNKIIFLQNAVNNG